MPTCELHVAFNISYVYDFFTQLRRLQAKVIQNHANATVRQTGQSEAMYKINIRELNLVAVMLTTINVTKLPF
jgi:hypothetical protein